MKIHEAVAAARHRLRAAGIPDDEAELDARLLAEHVLGWSTEHYFADADSPVPDGFESGFEALIARRAAREPFAYIVGRQEFWGLQFHVTPAVLIPRPETELIVEETLQIVDTASRTRIVDVGTGSGCLAVVLAKERPGARIVATDISDAAIAVARGNATRHGVAERIDLRQADLLEGINHRFDLIVSNPPYVPEGERAGIQREVGFEPPRALFAGDDGLAVIRRLLPAAATRLETGGTLMFEFGFGQAEAVAGLISMQPEFTMVDLRRDLQQIPRVAVVRRMA